MLYFIHGRHIRWVFRSINYVVVFFVILPFSSFLQRTCWHSLPWPRHTFPTSFLSQSSHPIMQPEKISNITRCVKTAVEIHVSNKIFMYLHMDYVWVYSLYVYKLGCIQLWAVYPFSKVKDAYFYVPHSNYDIDFIWRTLSIGKLC